eukprot:gene9172-10871_t
MGNGASAVAVDELFGWAHKGNDAVIMTKLAENPKNINAIERSTGNTLLHYAAAKGMVRLCEALLGVEGIDPNISNLHGTSPLVLACGNGLTDVVMALVDDPRVDPNRLMHASNLSDGVWRIGFTRGGLKGAEWCSESTVELRGRVGDLSQSSGDVSALHLAAQKGRIGALKALLSCPRLDPNISNMTSGDTALHISTRAGRKKVTRLLLEDHRTVHTLRNAAGELPQITEQDLQKARGGKLNKDKSKPPINVGAITSSDDSAAIVATPAPDDATPAPDKSLTPALEAPPPVEGARESVPADQESANENLGHEPMDKNAFLDNLAAEAEEDTMIEVTNTYIEKTQKAPPKVDTQPEPKSRRDQGKTNSLPLMQKGGENTADLEEDLRKVDAGENGAKPEDAALQEEDKVQEDAFGEEGHQNSNTQEDGPPSEATSMSLSKLEQDQSEHSMFPKRSVKPEGSFHLPTPEMSAVHEEMPVITAPLTPKKKGLLGFFNYIQEKVTGKVPSYIRVPIMPTEAFDPDALCREWEACARAHAHYSRKLLREGMGMKGDNAAAVVEAGGIEAVISAMLKHTSNTEVQQSGCRALINISDSPDRQLKVADEHGTRAVLEAMTAHPDNGRVQHFGCWALVNIAVHPDNKELVAEDGAIAVVINSMNMHIDNADMQHVGCWFLRNLAQNDDNKYLIVQGMGLEAILSAMRHHPTKLDVQDYACKALVHLLQDIPEHQEIGLRNGVVESVITSLYSFGHKASLQHQGCWVLAALTDDDEENQ